MDDLEKRGRITARQPEIDKLAIPMANPSESLLCELDSIEKMSSETKNHKNKDEENQQFGNGQYENYLCLSY